jgi:hypothetical protein
VLHSRIEKVEDLYISHAAPSRIRYSAKCGIHLVGLCSP